MQFFGKHLLAAAALLLTTAMSYPGQAHLEKVATQVTEIVPFNYLFTVFTWGAESNMFVYISPDGIDFTLVKGPAYVSLPAPSSSSSLWLTRYSDPDKLSDPRSFAPSSLRRVLLYHTYHLL